MFFERKVKICQIAKTKEDIGVQIRMDGVLTSSVTEVPGMAKTGPLISGFASSSPLTI